MQNGSSEAAVFLSVSRRGADDFCVTQPIKYGLLSGFPQVKNHLFLR
jgi:hypothetical protein